MFIWLLNWRQRIIIVGFIALLLLLGSSSNWPTTRLLWGGWWVQQQQLPKNTTRRTVKRRVKLPDWYLHLQMWYLSWQAKCRPWRSVALGEVSPLAKCSKKGVSAAVGVLFVGLVCGGVDLALTMGHLLDDEGGECPILTGKLGLGRGLALAHGFSNSAASVANASATGLRGS